MHRRPSRHRRGPRPRTGSRRGASAAIRSPYLKPAARGSQDRFSPGVKGYRSRASSRMPSGPGPMVPRMSNRDAYELLLIEEADAWFEYLEATREQLEIRYKEVEPWAWARLNQRLRAIRTKKQKLKPAAAA